MSGKEDRIRRRAYEMWEREGRPAGKEADHWHRAARELEAEDASGVSGVAETSPRKRSVARTRKPTEQAAAAPPKPKRETASRSPRATKESAAKAGAGTRRRTSKQTGG